MAKRSRGSVRPGQRQPLRRSTRPSGGASSRPATPSTSADATAPDAAATSPEAGLTAADEARAAELEARIVAEERAAEATTRRSTQRATPAAPAPRRARGGGTMAVRYADEYAYVARDLRRIGIVSALLLAVLAVLFVLIQVVDVSI